MLAKVQQWLKPPIFSDDEDKSAQARVMDTLGMYFALALIIAAVVYVPFFAKYKLSSFSIILMMLVIYGIARYNLFRGRLMLAALLVIGSGWLVCVILIAIGGGMNSPMMAVLTSMTIVVGLLLPEKTGNIFLLINMVMILGFAFLQQRLESLPQYFSYPPLSAWFLFATALAFMKATIDLTVRNLRNALARAHQQNEAFQCSEAKFRAVVENSNDGIFFVDANGKILYRSPSVSHITGFPHDGQMGHNAFDRVFSDDLNALRQGWMETLQHPETSLKVEHRIWHKDGTVRWLETSAKNLLNNPNIQAAVITFHDITERKRAEQALEESEARYRNLYENATVGIYRTTPDGQIIMANPAAIHLLGFETLEELAARDLKADGFDPSSPRSEFQAQVEKDGMVAGFESSWIKKDGTPIFVRESARAIRDPSGTVLYYDGVFEDITNHKRAMDALQQAEEQFRAVVQTANDAIITVNDRQTITLWNAAAEKIFGFSTGEALGMPVTQIVPLEFHQRDQWDGKAVETIGFNKCGKEFPIEMSLAGWSTRAGKFVTAIIRDIGERKQRENEMYVIATFNAALRTASTSQEMPSVVVDQVAKLMDVDSLTVEMIDPQTGEWVVKAAHGSWKPLTGLRLTIKPGIDASNTRSPQLYHTGDLESEVNLPYPKWACHGIRGSIGVPLVAQEQLIGFIWVGRKTLITDAEARLLQAIADIVANAIHRATLHEQTVKATQDLSLAYDTTLLGWAYALELRDQETEGHSQRVVDMVLKLALRFNFNEAELVHIRRGAILHDIGKMGIPDAILHKPGPLTEDEWTIMRNHPVYAYDLLSPIAYLRQALDIPYCHHEKWDGSGYPRGLKGEQIPLAARIFAVVDVWDALRSDRPYRRSWPEQKVLAYISSQAGIHFDPKVAALFLELVKTLS